MSDGSAIPSGMLRAADPAFGPRFVRGAGAWLWDADGRDYIDFTSGYSSLNFGHAHPRLVAAATEQLSTITQLVGHHHPWRDKLTSRLAAIAPMPQPVKVWLSTTGARAVELAWKIAWKRRPGKLVSFQQGFHGRSLATSQLSETARIDWDWIPAKRQLLYPDCLHCELQLHPDSCQAACADRWENWIDENADQISAIIVEPGLGARGYYFPPPTFFHRLRRKSLDKQILLIDDEIQMGLGRTGAAFACERQGWSPDLIILGKSLGGGLVPISAVIGSANLMDSLAEGVESETFAGNPLGCRIGCEVLKLLADGGLYARANEIGARLRAGLQGVLPASDKTRVVQSYGAAATIECYPCDPRRGSAIAKAWVAASLERRVLVQWTGRYQNRIAFIPPLVVDNRDLSEGIDRFWAAYPGSH